MAESLARDLRHDCFIPAGPVGKRWVCPMCRRMWTRTSPTGNRTDDEPGVPVAVTFRYPDGSTQTFSAMSGCRECSGDG